MKFFCHFIGIAASLFFCLSVQAQDNNGKEGLFYLNIIPETYHTNDNYELRTNDLLHRQERHLDLMSFSGAFRIQKAANRFREYELVALNYEKEALDLEVIDNNGNVDYKLFGAETSHFYFSLGIEEQFSLKSLEYSDRWGVRIGLGLIPYISSLQSTSTVSTSIPISEVRTGFELATSPRVVYYVSDHYFLDLSGSLNFFDFQYNHIKLKDPSGQRNFEGFYSKLGRNLMVFRVGLGVRI